jgi:hypothetical protein
MTTLNHLPTSGMDNDILDGFDLLDAEMSDFVFDEELSSGLDDLESAADEFLAAHAEEPEIEDAEIEDEETTRANLRREGSSIAGLTGIEVWARVDADLPHWDETGGDVDPETGIEVKAVDKTSWEVDAVCATADPESWFPDRGGSSASAKKICASCPVRRPCLMYSLDADERFGVWGGYSERERRIIKRSRQEFLTLTVVNGTKKAI